MTANGCGKSSIFDAWCWCLFGRTPRNLRNPDVTPWASKHKPLVLNHFKIDDTEHWVTRVPGELTCDGKEISQDELNELLGFGYELAVNAILLAQGKDLFFDLEPKAKLELFSNALGLERWEARSKMASEATKDADAEVLQLQMQLRGYEGELDATKDLLAKTKEEAGKWGLEARKRARDVTKRRNELKAELEKQENALGSARLRQDGAGTEAKALRAEIGKLGGEVNKAEVALARLEDQITSTNSQWIRVGEELLDLTTAEVCPTCGQTVKPADLDRHREALRTKNAALATAMHDLKSGVLKLEKAVKFYNEKLTKAEKDLEGFAAREEAAEAEVHRRTPEVATLKAELAQLAKAVEEVNPYEDTIRTLMVKVKNAEATLKAFQGRIEEAERVAERKRFWIKGFRDLKLELITDVLQDFELTTNSMIEQVGLKDWEIFYSIEQETKSGSVIRAINVQIKSPDSPQKVKWDSWSGGEQQRLKMIGALALSDTLLAAAGVETNLEILDEPASYWSTEGVQDMIAFLADRAKVQGKSIYLVEHSAVESSHFVRTLKVIKNKEGAYLE